MEIRKLKPDRTIWGALAPISTILLFGLAYILFGLYAAFNIVAGWIMLYALYSFVGLIRTHNYGYLIATVYLIIVSLLFFSLPISIKTGEKTLTRYMMIGLFFWGSTLLGQILTKNMKWRGREIFELAAKPIDVTSSGYTTRPMPVGTTEYSRHQLLSFAEFARRRLLAYVEITREYVRFYPIKMGSEQYSILGLRKTDQDNSYVTFEFSGPVSVYISERDYLDFKDDLAFDLLCNSLANVYIDFIELYRAGEEKTIFQQLNSLGYGFFS